MPHSFRLLSSVVAIFGPADAKRGNLSSWSLQHLQENSDGPCNTTLVHLLSQEFCGLEVTEAFAPNVVPASAHIAESKDLIDQIWLRGSRSLFRNQYLPADGVFLNVHQAFVMSAAGCPVIIATAGDYMLATHAARDSLIERDAVIGHPTREHLSVVDTIIEQFKWRGAVANDITMVMLFAIPPREFEHSPNHPKHGSYNQALATFIDERWPGGIMRKDDRTFLNLEQVFIEQALQAGIRHVWAEHSLTKYDDLVHTCVGDNAGQRNLIVVKRE